jgi:uncharacterized protein YdhG (YjbR/CyaY superfamily)
MDTASAAESIDEYISGFPLATQAVLTEMRSIILSAVPDATETISYAMPAFDMNGQHVVFFAGYAKHVGLYPAPSSVDAFRNDLSPYKQGKGSVQFPLGEPLPRELIRRIVEYRVGLVSGDAGR